MWAEIPGPTCYRTLRTRPIPRQSGQLYRPRSGLWSVVIERTWTLEPLSILIQPTAFTLFLDGRSRAFQCVLIPLFPSQLRGNPGAKKTVEDLGHATSAGWEMGSSQVCASRGMWEPEPLRSPFHCHVDRCDNIMSVQNSTS